MKKLFVYNFTIIFIIVLNIIQPVKADLASDLLKLAGDAAEKNKKEFAKWGIKSGKDIIGINIPTGIPLAFNYEDDKLTKIGYLGDQEQIIKLQKEVEQQSRIKKG